MNWSDYVNSNPLADIRAMQEKMRNQGYQEPNVLIMSPRAAQLYEVFLYDWAGKIDWNSLLAPRITRLLRRIKRRRQRIRWWWQDHFGEEQY